MVLFVMCPVALINCFTGVLITESILVLYNDVIKLKVGPLPNNTNLL